MNIEIEQWTRFSPSFVDDKVVECVVLGDVGQKDISIMEKYETNMGYNKVFLHERGLEKELVK